MRKIYRLIIISILICAISYVSYAADLNELQDQRNEIQNQMNESNTELSDVNDELTQNLQQIQKLDENIQTTEENLKNLNKEISAKEEEISKIQEEINELTQKYNTQKELLDARLVAMYETENTNYLDVVLGADSISDFISTYYLISEITSYDIDLLELVERQRQEIEEKSQEINNKKESLEQEEYNKQINEIEAEIKSLAATITFGEDYRGGTMQWPIYGHYTITSNFGMRTHPITGIYKLHTGVDISAGIGTDFTAMANGIVVKAEYNGAYGNMVIIDHGGGVQTLYAHGSEIIAQVGQEVKAGDVVLKVGSTGYSTGPHAHFEVRVNGTPVNPLDYVSIPEQ